MSAKAAPDFIKCALIPTRSRVNFVTRRADATNDDR
jgi:hypothetical protein